MRIARCSTQRIPNAVNISKMELLETIFYIRCLVMQHIETIQYFESEELQEIFFIHNN
jgi:hypothetical protein